MNVFRSKKQLFPPETPAHEDIIQVDVKRQRKPPEATVHINK